MVEQNSQACEQCSSAEQYSRACERCSSPQSRTGRHWDALADARVAAVRVVDEAEETGNLGLFALLARGTQLPLNPAALLARFGLLRILLEM